MTPVEVEWSEATLESGLGNRFWVTVPISAERDEFWDLSFRAVLHERAAEKPQSSWSTIGLLNESVVVGGVARQSMDAVREFVDDCVRRANEHIATERAERLQSLQDQLRAQDEEARRLTEELRSRAG